MEHEKFFQVVGMISPNYNLQPFRELLTFYEEETIGRTYNLQDAASIEERIRILATCLRQVCLARSQELYVGVLGAMAAGNIYSTVALMRAHLETSSVLGHVCRMVHNVHNDPSCQIEVDKKLFNLLCGTRNQTLLDAGAPEMTGIMSVIDSADKALYILVHKARGRKNTGELRGAYDFLSEYAHPNFHSNSLAFTFDEITGNIVFNKRDGISETDVQILSHLGISATVFVTFYRALDVESEDPAAE